MSLFLKENLEKTASVKLSEDSVKWTKQIITNLLEKFPIFSEFPLTVEYKFIDKERGFAVGVLSISKQLALPILIDNFYLYDLDLATFNGRLVPFNEYTMSILTNQPSAFKGVAPIEEDSVLNKLFLHQMEVIDPVVKTSSVQEPLKLEQIEDKIYKDDAKTVYDALEKDAALKVLLEHYGKDSLEELKELAEHGVEKVAKVNLANKLDVDIFMLKKENEFEYRIKLAQSGIDEHVETVVDEPTAKKLFEKYYKNTSQPSFEKTAKVKDSYETYEIYPLNNYQENKTLYVFDNGNYAVMSNELEKRAEQFVAIDPEDGTEKIVNVLEPKDDTKNKQKIEKPGIAKPKKVIEVMPVENTEVAIKVDDKITTPVKVIKTASINGDLQLLGSDGLNYYKFKTMEGIDDFYTEDGYEYLLPKTAEFIEFKHEMKMVPFDGSEKTAHRIIKDPVGTYHLDGPLFEKYASKNNKIRDLDEEEAAFILLKFKMNPEELVKIGEARNEYYIKSELVEPKSLDEFVEEENTKIAKELKLVNEIRQELETINLVKLAAESTKAKDTINSVLALNFITKETINEFVEALPGYEALLSSLCKLLLYIRLGLKSLPEASLAKLIKGLSKISMYLYELASVVKEK